MRRSGAPSQHDPAAKRTRFISPFLRLAEDVTKKERTTSDVLNLIAKGQGQPQPER